MKPSEYPQADAVDIAILIEGSYPFVTGGVASWIHQIILNFPEYTFGLLFLGSAPEFYKKGIRYQLPPNVKHLQVVYLFDNETTPPPEQLAGNQVGFEKIAALHELFRCPGAKLMEKIGDLSLYLDPKSGVDYKQFLYSKLSWDYITEQYTQHCTDPSFIDYFWTIKNIHRPLWPIINMVKNVPKIKVMHTVSTGYAGFLGALLYHHYHYPLILTEHGIYTKERRIDIFHSDLSRNTDIDRSLINLSYLSNLWNRYFSTLAHLCYDVSDPIISLYSVSHEVQIQEGAPEQKTLIIPNGVDIARLSKLRRPLAERSCVICFMGRVVPIKDVKGLVRAIAIVSKKIPDVKTWIVGPIDEDEEYAQETQDLVTNLSLQEVVEFKSYQKIENILPNIRLMVLSSISEGMPLVILESFAAGVPVVATDVGASRELVYGVAPEDQQIGAAGRIVRIADSPQLAHAIIELLENNELWESASQAGVKRVETYYDEKDMVQRYREIYAASMAESAKII